MLGFLDSGRDRVWTVSFRLDSPFSSSLQSLTLKVLSSSATRMTGRPPSPIECLREGTKEQNETMGSDVKELQFIVRKVKTILYSSSGRVRTDI